MKMQLPVLQTFRFYGVKVLYTEREKLRECGYSGEMADYILNIYKRSAEYI